MIRLSWLSKLLGRGTETAATDFDAGSKDEDDTYTVAWRNRYLVARITHLDKKISKKKIAGVIHFELPEDVQSGDLESLQALNQKLAKRIEYLEGLLKGR